MAPLKKTSNAVEGFTVMVCNLTFFETEKKRTGY